MTLWEKDVAAAMLAATAGQGDADTSRVLAAEVHRLRADLCGASTLEPEPGHETQVPHGV